MNPSTELHDAVYDLAQKLLAHGATDGSIARAGGMTRQALQARGLNRPTGTRPKLLGFGFAILRAAYQQGFIPEVIAVLSGKQTQLTTGQTAVWLFPDLSSEELWKLIVLEELLNTKPLSGELIKKIVHTLRTPPS